MSRQTFGRYEIKKELGRGGMATVYHAYDPHFQRDVALKVLPPQFSHDPTFRTRFIREAQTVAALEHPAIVPVYDFGEEDNLPFLVMRFLPGGSLADRLEIGKIPLDETTRILNRLAPALDEAHSQGIIHRDLKPDNILFDQRNDPYITDFGIAKMSEESGQLTTGGVIIGTPAYMSPEQASGVELDGRSDVYSLGIILFQMLTGRLPFEAKTPVALIMNHITKPVPPILEVNPNLPAICDPVVAKALAKDRDERYSTATALAMALAQLEQPQPPETETEAEPQTETETETEPQTETEREMGTEPETETTKRVVKPLPSRKKRTVSKSDRTIRSLSQTSEESQVVCPSCDTVNSKQTSTCQTCNARLKTECPVCFRLNWVDAVHCSNCGTDLKRAQVMRQNLQTERKRRLAQRDLAYKQKAARQFKQKIPQLLKDLDSRKKRTAAMNQLGQVLDQAVYVLTENMLIDSDTEARIESMRVLEQICERKEITTEIKTKITDAFIELLEDPVSRVRHEAQQTLENMGSGRTREISDIFNSLVGWVKGD